MYQFLVGIHHIINCRSLLPGTNHCIGICWPGNQYHKIHREMTIETAQMVVDGYSWKITQYNNQRVFNISQGEIAILDKVVLEELKVGTN